jgi:hypothetical protein
MATNPFNPVTQPIEYQSFQASNASQTGSGGTGGSGGGGNVLDTFGAIFDLIGTGSEIALPWYGAIEGRDVSTPRGSTGDAGRQVITPQAAPVPTIATDPNAWVKPVLIGGGILAVIVLIIFLMRRK